MAKGTSSSHRAKGEENNAAKRRQSTIKASKVSSAVNVDKSGLRKSESEDSPKKTIITRSSSSRKCEGNERQTPPTPTVKRKSAMNENQQTPSSLRRSERGKKQPSPASSGLKKSDRGSCSSDIKHRQERKEKRAKLLKLESPKISKIAEKDLKTVQVKDRYEEPNNQVKLSNSGIDSSGGEINYGNDNNDKREELKAGDNDGRASEEALKISKTKSKFLVEVIDNNNVAEFPRASQKRIMGDEASEHKDGIGDRLCQSDIVAKQIADEHERADLDFSEKDIQIPLCIVMNSPLNDSTGDIIDLEKNCEILSLKRKRNYADTYSDDAAVVEKTIDSTSTAELPSPSSSFCSQSCPVETCDTCFKRQRMNNDTMNREICLCSTLNLQALAFIDVYGVVHEKPEASGSMKSFENCDNSRKQNDPSADIGTNTDQNASCKLEGKLLMNNDTMNQEIVLCSTLHQQALAFIDVYGVVHERPETSGNMKSFEIRDNSRKQNTPSADLGTNTDQNTCFTCKLGGKLLCCDGRDCGRSFHLSCLDPPLEGVPFGVWHCLACVKKKIKFGVHSVSGSFESIWDSRVEEVSDVDGVPKQRQYFVKYKDLAHVHNRWVPATELFAEDPFLLSKYDSRSQWNQEWAVPHRLLQKRLLFSSIHSGENAGKLEGEKHGCQNEWLVKWHGLDYEHATWELENASFITSGLIRNYENRRKKAMVDFNLCQENKIQERERMVAIQLGDKDPRGLNGNHLGNINKLCEFFHKGHNAIVIDDQDRIAKIVAFILTVKPGINRPFLIISTHAAISLWDNEFLQSAPSVNTVIYKGTKKNRKIIQSYDFYEGGCITFEVLVIPSEIILEDLDVLNGIKWEAVVVDECDRRIVSSKFEQIKKLTTNMKLLLFNHLKESKDEYVSVLSLLDVNIESGVIADSTASSIENIGTLKERFSRHVAYAYTSRFVEYWVPAQISQVQLEQYCCNLLLNSTSLSSSSRNDHVGALRDILISTRKCCNHPYILDPSLQTLLTKDRELIEYLDVGIQASGKLQLLDAMLTEMKKRCLRVLILFKSNSGSGRDSIGDILDDFLRQKFGADSYERVEGGLLYSKKLAALNKFNDNESQRFVFLLEFRACLPSIKLSSVDSVIIYDSDWTPMNDLRALQKITIDPQFEQIKIFRLYSSCTVEERVLMLALKNKAVDNSLQNIIPSTSHTLLMWGASHLFDNLEKFHESKISSLNTLTFAKESLLQDVVHDLVSVLPNNDKSLFPRELQIIIKAQQVEGSYHTGQPLLGELKISQTQDILPHLFWSKLLKGKNPRWIFSSVPARNRKRSQCQLNYELPIEPDLERDKVKRRKKVLTSEISRTSSKVGLEGETTDGKRDDGSEDPETMTLCSPRYNDRENNVSSPMLSHETSGIAWILNNNVVDLHEEKELCGTQTSVYHLLRPGILKLCQILQFPENVKDMVKKFFVYVVENHHINHETETIQQAFQLSLCWTAAHWLHYKISHNESMALAKEKLDFDCKKEEADFVYLKLRCMRNMFFCNLAQKKVASEIPLIGDKQNLAAKKPRLKSNIARLEIEDLLQNQILQPKMDSELVHRDLSMSVKLIKKKFRKRLSKLIEKQHEQKNEVKRNSEEVILQIEKSNQLESAVIRQLHGNSSIGIAKLKSLEKEFAKKIEDSKRQMEIRLKVLEEEQLTARNKIEEKEAHLVEELKSWAHLELLNKQSPNKTTDKNSQSVSDPHAGPNKFVEDLQELREKNSEVSETIPHKAVEYNENVNADVEGQDKLISSSDVLDNVITLNSSSNTEDYGDGPLENPGPAITNDLVEHLISSQPPISATLTFNAGSCEPDKDNSCEKLQMDNSSKATDGVLIPTSPVSEVNRASTGIPDEELVQELSESILVSVGLDRNMHLNQEKNPSEATPIILDKEVPLEVSLSTAENLLTVEDQIPIDVTAIIPDEEILLQTLQPASDHVAENNNCDVNGMDLSVSDYDLDFNQPDSLSNVNGQVIPPNELLPMNLLAALPSGTTVTQGTPIPSNQGQTILPSSYPESLVPGTLLHSAVNFVPQPSSYLDPLQNELERIHKEAEDFIKASHEKTVQLKSDCEKEIEEVTAQIRSKYNTKLQDTEAEFTLRKKERDKYYYKVLMNKRLAYAFKSKCIDLRLSRNPGFQRDVISAMQNRRQPTQTARRPLPVQIPTTTPPSNLSSSTIQPIPIVPIPHPSLSTNRFTLPSRPPLISSVSSSAPNLQGDGAIRSPAPHMQPFRALPTVSASSIPRHTPSIQVASDRPPSSSPSYPQLQPRLPLPSNPPITELNGPMNLLSPNSSLSALGLFMDVNRRAGVVLPNSADICSILSASSALPAGTTHNTQVNLRDGDGLDIVSLSDDE